MENNFVTIPGISVSGLAESRAFAAIVLSVGFAFLIASTEKGGTLVPTNIAFTRLLRRNFAKT